MSEFNPNPYESSAVNLTESSQSVSDGRRASRRVYLALFASHTFSLILFVPMVAGCFVTYAPNAKASEIQNIFISNVLFYSALICGLQVYGILILLKLWRSWELRHVGMTNGSAQSGQ